MNVDKVLRELRIGFRTNIYATVNDCGVEGEDVLDGVFESLIVMGLVVGDSDGFTD